MGIYISNVELQVYCVAFPISSPAETRDRALSFFREVDFMRSFPVAFLTNGIFVVTCV